MPAGPGAPLTEEHLIPRALGQLGLPGHELTRHIAWDIGIAGVATTLRAANRQFASIASDLKYALPSANPFDRIIDTDTPWRSDQDYGGATESGNVGLPVNFRGTCRIAQPSGQCLTR